MNIRFLVSLSTNISRLPHKNYLTFHTLAIMIILYSSLSKANLICNGDFQNYTLNFDGYSSDDLQFRGAEITNNYSCWYTNTPNLAYVQVKTTKNPSLSTTNVADTIGIQKTSLCQNVSLEVNATYQLRYHILTDFSIDNCNVSFSRSGYKQYIGFYPNSNISYLEDLLFIALNPYQEICFFPDNITYKSPFASRGPSSWGPMVDNVSLSFVSRPIKTFEINFDLTYDSIDNKITLESDFCFSCLLQYSLPISFFNSIQIKIEDNVEDVFVVAVDSHNLLQIVVNLKLQYDLQNFKRIELIIPNTTYLNFICLIDGRPTNISSQSEQSRFVKTVLPVAKFVSEAVRNSFYLLNAFAFSYFIVNLISFYNITLLYYFLHLNILPGFVRCFILSLAHIFFKRGSVLDQIQRFGWIRADFQFDFSTLKIFQKMDLYINGSSLWFAYYDIYTNFVQSNIQPLILLFFLLFKFGLLKLIVHPFPMLKRKANLKWGNFFQKFSIEFSCFTPFLIISAATSLLNVSEIFFTGKLNSVVHILVIFGIFLIPLLSFLRSKRKIQKMKAVLRKDKNLFSPNKMRKKIKIKLLETTEEFTSSAMSFIIPFFILVQSPPIFFTFTTPLILKKIITVISHRKVCSCYRNIMRFFNNLAWATHHFSFLGLYVIQLTLEVNQSISRQITDDIITLLGYAIIGSILIGGLFDILNSLSEAANQFLILLKKAWSLLKKDVIVVQRETEAEVKNKKEKSKENKQRSKNQKKNYVGVLKMRLQQQIKNKIEQQKKAKLIKNGNETFDQGRLKAKNYFQQITQRKIRKNGRMANKKKMIKRIS